LGRRPATKPRKRASQERSRATVAALVEATARILVSEGFDKASTNRIAEVAGVSVGSLYQYFPSKEALVIAVAERHHQDIMQVVRGTLGRIAGLPVEDAVRSIVAVAVDAHRIDPKLHCVLSEQIPRTDRLENVDPVNREAHDLFRAYLESRRDQLQVTNVELAAFVCATSIEAVAHHAVLHQSKMPPEEVDLLINEASRMIVGYLKRTQ